MLVVSNTQPYEHTYHGDTIEANSLISGLTESLDQVLSRKNGTWVAWGDGEADYQVTDNEGRVEVPPGDESYTLKRVKLSDEETDKHYEGFCNRVVWPVCHGILDNVYNKRGYWKYYQQVNEKFADAVVEEVDDDETIWIQDYHFMLTPEMVRERVSDDTTLKHFWHIPWPSTDTFEVCPQKTELLRGMLANDEIGFHISEYKDNFIECVEQYCPEAEVDGDTVRLDGHSTEVVASPLGVDVEDLTESAESLNETDWESFKQDHGITTDTVLLGVERIDYMKGIPRRLDAFELLLEENEDLHGEVTYVQKSSVSRGNIPEYDELGDVTDERIEEINERFGTSAWTPVVHIKERIPERDLNLMYRFSDVLLVTSLIDGMNLVSQEYVACSVEYEGALVLSKFAGSWEILSGGAYTVNPYDTPQVAEQIGRAIREDAYRQEGRMKLMRRAVEHNDINEWL